MDFYHQNSLHKLHDEAKDKPFELEMAWITEGNGWKTQAVPRTLMCACLMGGGWMPWMDGCCGWMDVWKRPSMDMMYDAKRLNSYSITPCDATTCLTPCSEEAEAWAKAAIEAEDMDEDSDHEAPTVSS